MKKIKDLYFESFLSYIILMFKDKIIPYVKDEFFNSFIFKAWSWFERVIFDLKIVKFLFYTQYTAEVWYKSSLYTRMTARAEKISGKFERTYISFDIIYRSVHGCDYSYTRFDLEHRVLGNKPCGADAFLSVAQHYKQDGNGFVYGKFPDIYICNTD